MGPVSGIVVYVLVWWVVFLCALPYGHRNQENPEDGSVHSAPEHPNLGKKAIVTSVISVVIWVVIYILIDVRIIDFREMAAQMPL